MLAVEIRRPAALAGFGLSPGAPEVSWPRRSPLPEDDQQRRSQASIRVSRQLGEGANCDDQSSWSGYAGFFKDTTCNVPMTAYGGRSAPCVVGIVDCCDHTSPARSTPRNISNTSNSQQKTAARWPQIGHHRRNGGKDETNRHSFVATGGHGDPRHRVCADSPQPPA